MRLLPSADPPGPSRVPERRVFPALLVLAALSSSTWPAPLPAAPSDYQSIELRSPEPAETVHNNRGDVTVDVVLVPALRTGEGHSLQVSIDGTVRPGQWHSERFVLPGVDRGQHSLQVFAVDAEGRRLIASGTVTFFVWQASRLFPSRRAP